METLSKLAGVQDASQHMQPSNTSNDRPSIPQQNDVEAQTPTTPTIRKPSRASLPLDRRPSRKSLYSNHSNPGLGAQNEDIPPLPTGTRYTASRSSHDTHPSDGSDDAAYDEDEGEDIPWGPAHPCFPHPNPHVPLNSQARASTRIIRVQRDWLVSGDLYPAFANMYPEILADWITEVEFRTLIETVNTMCEKSFSATNTRAMVDSVLGVFTGFLWDDAGFAGSKNGEKKIEQWMDAWNMRKREQGIDVSLIPLRKTGFLNLDIQIPDPEIDVPFEDDGVTASRVGNI